MVAGVAVAAAGDDAGGADAVTSGFSSSVVADRHLQKLSLVLEFPLHDLGKWQTDEDPDSVEHLDQTTWIAGGPISKLKWDSFQEN